MVFELRLHGAGIEIFMRLLVRAFFVSTYNPHLFPHDDVEATTGLISKHNPCIVVITVGIHIKCHTEVYSAELVIPCSNIDILAFLQKLICNSVSSLSHLKQFQGQSWLSAIVLSPDCGSPIRGQTVWCLWGPTGHPETS